MSSEDRDYRMAFTLDNLKLPPPPPPPLNNIPEVNQTKKIGISPRKLQDNVESIDMELSDDESTVTDVKSVNDNLKVVPIMNNIDTNPGLLEPPPPLPELPDDVDANTFLDDLDNDLNSNEFLEQDDHDNGENSYMQGNTQFPLGYESNTPTGIWNNIPPPPTMPPNICNMFQPNMGNMLNNNLDLPTNMNEGPPQFNPIPTQMNMTAPQSNWNDASHRGRGRHNRGHSDFHGRGWPGNNRGFRGRSFRGSSRGGGNRNNNRGGRPYFRGNFRGNFQ